MQTQRPAVLERQRGQARLARTKQQSAGLVLAAVALLARSQPSPEPQARPLPAPL